MLGFSSAAEVYERARPDYPQAAIDWLAERLPLEPGLTVVDLAAGTGKLTRQLLPTGATVIAVEPLAEMRAELERAVPSVQALEGVAEAIPLANASADAATVAQGFHWFEVERAARELHRVLRPGGALALIWNARDDADPLHRAIDEILDPLRRSAPAAKERHWKARSSGRGSSPGRTSASSGTSSASTPTGSPTASPRSVLSPRCPRPGVARCSRRSVP